jgi:uncharacterized protein (DUF2141 family)
MKKNHPLLRGLFILILSVITSFSVLAQDNNTDPVKTGILEIEITNLINDKGQVIIMLVNNTEDFDKISFVDERVITKDKLVIAKVIKNITDKKVILRFDDLPYGNYGIKYLHDINMIHELDFNFLHIPEERYGFSNNAHRNFMPPKFEDAIIKIDKPLLSISLKALNLGFLN